MDKQGLSQEKIKNSGKKYIITDFCFTHRSLNGAYRLFRQHDVLGTKNIIHTDVEECISNHQLRRELHKKLKYCHFKQYSFVNKAYFLKDVPNGITDTSQESLETKLIWFNLLDNYMQKTPPKKIDIKKLSFIQKLKQNVCHIFKKD